MLQSLTLSEQAATVVLFAAENEGLPSWAQIAIALGVAVSLATKQLVPGWVYQDLKTRAEQLEKDKKELIDSQLTVLPEVTTALKTAADANQKSLDEIRLLRQERDERLKKGRGS